jgi:CRISPR-associated exonuclease Cas4
MEAELENAKREIKSIIQMEAPPPPKRTRFCSKCGYREFCWA